jgi:superfamily II DNA or RNA helicase
VLVGIDTIKEGFDDPGVHGVMFVYPIGSLVGLIQGGGRATRLDKLCPNKIAYIVQLMFKGKSQVFYNSVLEGDTLLVPDNEAGEVPRDFDVVTTRELANVHDEIITDVSVEHEEIMRLVREYDPLDFFYNASREHQILEIRNTLAEKGITSMSELYAFGTMRFNKTTFLPFGMGRAFCFAYSWSSDI